MGGDTRACARAACTVSNTRASCESAPTAHAAHAHMSSMPRSRKVVLRVRGGDCSDSDSLSLSLSWGNVSVACTGVERTTESSGTEEKTARRTMRVENTGVGEGAGVPATAAPPPAEAVRSDRALALPPRAAAPTTGGGDVDVGGAGDAAGEGDDEMATNGAP